MLSCEPPFNSLADGRIARAASSVWWCRPDLSPTPAQSWFLTIGQCQRSLPFDEPTVQANILLPSRTITNTNWVPG
jgi:hypothetical protein